MATDDRWWGARARLHVAAWRGTTDTVVLSLVPDRPGPTASDIEQALEPLAERGVRRVLTGALHHGEVAPFLQAGFEVHERLHLLRHDLAVRPPASRAIHTRRAWRRDQPAILELDARAFDEFWTLDRSGLHDALQATPTSRFRVIGSAGVSGYAITGKAGRRGYLQRLAVSPDCQGQGLGTALVTDSLRWLRRSGASSAVVNTQVGNEAALALYLANGFVDESNGLTVLVRSLPEAAS